MSAPHILVFGATGTIGSEVIKTLAKNGVPFRAVIHTESKADQVKSLGSHIETVKVDIWNKESIGSALKGIEKVFLMLPPGQTKAGFIIVEALKDAGVKYVVKLSALGSEGDQFHAAKEHRDVEDAIAKAGIHFTSLRPSFFFTNSLMDLPTIKQSGTIFKAAADAKFNHVSNKDVGEIAALCLTEKGHEGKIYNLTGSDLINFHEYAKLLSEVIGKEIKYQPIDDEALRKSAATFLPNQAAVDGFSNMWQYFRDGHYNRTFPDLENLLKRKPTTLKTFFEQNKAAFL